MLLKSNSLVCVSMVKLLMKTFYLLWICNILVLPSKRDDLSSANSHRNNTNVIIESYLCFIYARVAVEAVDLLMTYFSTLDAINVHH